MIVVYDRVAQTYHRFDTPRAAAYWLGGKDSRRFEVLLPLGGLPHFDWYSYPVDALAAEIERRAAAAGPRP